MSENNAPHLPEQKTSVEPQISKVWWFLLTAIIACLAGVAAALSTIAWLVPNMSAGRTGQIAIESRQLKSEKLDPLMRQQLQQRTVEIYDRRKKIENFYPEESKVSDAVLLSSDGWAVMYDPNYQRGEYKYWDAIDNKGVVHEVEEFEYDSESKLVYMNLKGNNFRVSSIFNNWDQLNGLNNVWIKEDNNWKTHNLTEKSRISDKGISRLEKPRYYYPIKTNSKSGSLVVNKKGELLGLVSKDKRLIPSWYISDQLSQLLSGENIDYDFLGLKGIILERQVNKKIAQKRAGFYVTYSPSKANPVVQGDVILSVNGESLDKKDLARQIITAEEPITLEVLRDNEKHKIKIKNK